MVAVLGMCIKLQTGKKLVSTDRGVTSLTDEVLTVSLKVRVIQHCPYDTNSGLLKLKVNSLPWVGFRR